MVQGFVQVGWVSGLERVGSGVRGLRVSGP